MKLGSNLKKVMHVLSEIFLQRVLYRLKLICRKRIFKNIIMVKVGMIVKLSKSPKSWVEQKMLIFIPCFFFFLI